MNNFLRSKILCTSGIVGCCGSRPEISLRLGGFVSFETRLARKNRPRVKPGARLEAREHPENNNRVRDSGGKVLAVFVVKSLRLNGT